MQKQEIIVIGDVHGEQSWKKIREKHSGGKFVFLGDYCDPYDCGIVEEDVIENLRQIIEFKKEAPDKVVLLLGNHDIQYIYDEADFCSRYMHSVAYEIGSLFKENISLFEKVYNFGNILFTHAGITEEWYRTAFPDFEYSDAVSAINECRDTKTLFACGLARWGKELYGGIFWADRREFENPLYGWIQVAGHSKVPDILLKQTGDKEQGIIFCDCLMHGKYLSIYANLNGFTFYAQHIENDEKKLISRVVL